jgi:HD superfamily phosphohydrolase
MYALEGVVLSYFYMYRAIYYHHAVRAAYLLFQDIIWDAFDNSDYNLKGEIENLRDPNFWNHFDDHRFLSLLYSIKGLHSKLEQLVFRKLPKAVPLEKIGDHNITRIANLIGNHSYKDKVYKEREITKKLKDTYPELERILLDSTIVSPYPPSFRSGKLIYIWDEKMSNSEPENLASQATYLKVLEDTSENERAATIYVYPKSFRENSKFMDDLKLTCREELRSIPL